MRRRLLWGVLLCACGGSKPTPDAGRMVDTSCGLDCEAQRQFGLIANTCFEYSDTSFTASPPSLAAEVASVVELEGGLKVMQVRYTFGGQPRMKDSFTFKDGELYLVRREFGTGGTSVSYKKTSGELEGVKWLSVAAAAGENAMSTSSADVVAASRMSESTSYRVTLSEASGGDLASPLGGLDAGVKLLINETPDHGSDSRRVFVPGVGFSLIATPLMLSGGTSQEYRLQKVKSTADGGTACGF